MSKKRKEIDNQEFSDEGVLSEKRSKVDHTGWVDAYNFAKDKIDDHVTDEEEEEVHDSEEEEQNRMAYITVAESEKVRPVGRIKKPPTIPNKPKKKDRAPIPHRPPPTQQQTIANPDVVQGNENVAPPVPAPAQIELKSNSGDFKDEFFLRAVTTYIVDFYKFIDNLSKLDSSRMCINFEMDRIRLLAQTKEKTIRACINIDPQFFRFNDEEFYCERSVDFLITPSLFIKLLKKNNNKYNIMALFAEKVKSSISNNNTINAISHIDLSISYFNSSKFGKRLYSEHNRYNPTEDPSVTFDKEHCSPLRGGYIAFKTSIFLDTIKTLKDTHDHVTFRTNLREFYMECPGNHKFGPRKISFFNSSQKVESEDQNSKAKDEYQSFQLFQADSEGNFRAAGLKEDANYKSPADGPVYVSKELKKDSSDDNGQKNTWIVSTFEIKKLMMVKPFNNSGTVMITYTNNRPVTIVMHTDLVTATYYVTCSTIDTE